MGYMRHDAIVVTGWKKEQVEEVHNKAKQLCNPLVSEIIEGVSNSQYSFFIAPDGSKEGWEPSDFHEVARDRFISWLDKNTRYEDGSTGINAVAVNFGGDGGQAFIRDDHRSKE